MGNNFKSQVTTPLAVPFLKPFTAPVFTPVKTPEPDPEFTATQAIRIRARALFLNVSWNAVKAFALSLGGLWAAGPAQAQTAPALAPFFATGGSQLHPAWRLSGLPGKQAAPMTRFEASPQGGDTALRLGTDQSYGVLTHAWPPATPAPAELAWRWRLDQPLARPDLAIKSGDDAALKVCVMFDQALTDIPFFQRAALALARSATGQDIPNATLCYIWDSSYPAGTRGSNPYSARVRYIVLNGAETPTGQWVSQRRRIADDFQMMFGQESPNLPAVIAVAVGADSDNTQGQSLAYLAALRWLP